MSISRKYSVAVAAALLVAGCVGGALADPKMPAPMNKRALQANAKLIQSPQSAWTGSPRSAAPNNPREPAVSQNALALCEQCPPMIVLGIGF